MGRFTRRGRSAHNHLVARKALTKYREEQEKLQQEELELKLKNRRKPIMVDVQIQNGRLISIAVSPDDRVDDVKEKIKMKEGINPDQQILLFNGIKLIDGTVEEIGVIDSATIFLTLRNRGG